MADEKSLPAEGAQLSREYVESHQANIHTYDSFGRTVADLATQVAATAIERDGPVSDVQFDAKVRVSPVTRLGCLRICINTPVGVVCTHINV